MRNHSRNLMRSILQTKVPLTRPNYCANSSQVWTWWVFTRSNATDPTFGAFVNVAKLQPCESILFVIRPHYLPNHSIGGSDWLCAQRAQDVLHVRACSYREPFPEEEGSEMNRQNKLKHTNAGTDEKTPMERETEVRFGVRVLCKCQSQLFLSLPTHHHHHPRTLYSGFAIPSLPLGSFVNQTARFGVTWERGPRVIRTARKRGVT